MSSKKNKLCACGCGQWTWGKYVLGHQRRADFDQAPAEPEVEATPPVAEPPMPPAHPQPIDRRRWRLADERPGTPLTNPWLLTRCHNCLSPMYTRDELSTWEHGGYCEECSYVLRSELHNTEYRQSRVQALTIVDPFRPR